MRVHRPRHTRPGSARALIIGFLACLAFAFFAVPARADRPLAIAWNDTTSGTGLLAAISNEAPYATQTSSIAIALHSQLRSGGGRVYAISTTASEISVVDAATWQLERVLSIAAGGRPIDLAVVSSDVAYITRDGSSRLLKLDPTNGATSESVDLALFADPDGNPDLGWMAVYEGRLYVQVRRIDKGAFVPPALVAVIDIASEQIVDVDPVQPGVQAIELAGLAAKRDMQILTETRELAVLSSGGNNDAGGIERIDLDTLQSTGLVVAEVDGTTGTDLECMLFTRPTGGYLNAKTDIVLSSHLHGFSVGTGVDSTQLNGALFYEVERMVYDSTTDVFFLPEGGSYGDGIRVFDAVSGGLLLPDPIPTNGTPTGLAFVCDAVDGCAEPLCAAPGACGAVPMGAWMGWALPLALASLSVIALRGRPRRRAGYAPGR